jgi:TolA-binding protein
MKRITIILTILTLFRALSAQNTGDPFSYALKLYNEGFYDLASQQFSNYITSNPNGAQVPEAHYLLGKCYVQMKKPDLAIIELKKLALDYPRHEKAPLAWYEIGMLYYGQKRLKEAAKAFENVKILYPSNPLSPKGLLQAGTTYLKMENYEEAYRIFMDLLGRYSETPEALLSQIYLSEIELHRRNISNAIRLLEKLITVKEDSIKSKALIKLAKIHFQTGNLVNAVDFLNQVPGGFMDQEFADVKIKILWKNRKFEESILFLQKHKSLFASDQEWKRLIAISYARSGKLDQAIKILRDTKSDQTNLILLNTFAAKTGKAEVLRKHLLSVNNKQLRQQILRIAGKFFLEKGEPETFLNLMSEWIRDQQFKIDNDILISYIIKAIDLAPEYAKNRNLVQMLSSVSSSNRMIDDIAFIEILSAYRLQQYDRFTRYASIFMEKYPYSIYYPEVQKMMETVQYKYINPAKISFEDYLDILTSLIENKDVARKYLQLSSLYLKNTRNYMKAIRMARKAATSDVPKIKSQAFANLFEGYIGLYKQSGKKEYLDSAAAQLKIVMDENPDGNETQTMLINFFETSLPFILKNTKRREAALQKLASLAEEQDPNIGKMARYLYFILSPSDSQYVMMKKSYENLAEHPDRILYEGIELARMKNDTNLFLDVNLKLIRNYQNSFYVRYAVRNLLSYYFQKNDFNAWNQIFRFYNRSMSYCEELFSPVQYAAYLLSNGKTGELQELFKKQFPVRYTNELVMNEIYPQYNLFQFYLGKTYYLKDDYDQSITYLNRFLEGNVEDPVSRNEALKILAQIFMEQGNYDNAIWYLEQYDQLQKTTDEYAQVKLQLCKIYYQKKLYEKLFRITSRILSEKREYAEKPLFEYYHILAQIFMGKINLKAGALKQFEKKYKKDPTYKPYIAELYLAYARYEQKQKNFKTAHKLLDRAMKFANHDLKQKGEYIRGYLLTLQNDHEKALKILTKFSEKYPDSKYLCKVYNTLGNLYYRMEKKSEALEMYNKALQVAKQVDDEKLTLNNLIVLNKELGFWDGVLRACRQYISRFPEDAGNIDKQILIGLSYSRLNQFDEALRYLKQIKPYVPAEREPEVQFYIGEAYFNSGRYEEAIAEFLKIPMFSKKTKLQWEASAFYFAGQAYERLGKKNEAIKMYEEIVRRPGILWDLKKEAQKRIDQIR